MPPYCSKCRQEGHIPAKCPQKDKRASVPQSPTGQPPTPLDPQFSNPDNKCLPCSGNHRSAVCPTRSQHQLTPSTLSYVSSAGKPHNNMSSQQSTKNSQSTVCSTTPTLLVKNPHELQTTTQVTIFHRLPLRQIQMYPNNITSICLMLSHQHKCLTSFCLHLTSQFHFHHLLLHPLMYRQLHQLLHQTLQQR